MNASPSAIGPDHKTPSTPINTGKITAAGIRNRICLASVTIALLIGLPIAYRNIAATV